MAGSTLRYTMLSKLECMTAQGETLTDAIGSAHHKHPCSQPERLLAFPSLHVMCSAALDKCICIYPAASADEDEAGFFFIKPAS